MLGMSNSIKCGSCTTKILTREAVTLNTATGLATSRVRTGRVPHAMTERDSTTLTNHRHMRYTGHMTQVLFITRGVPASGKSTFAMRWVAEKPDSRSRVNRDDIRDNNLVVSGEFTQTSNVEQNGYVHRERSTGKFSRSLPLPSGTKVGSPSQSP